MVKKVTLSLLVMAILVSMVTACLGATKQVTVEGIVIGRLAEGLYRVKIENGNIITASLSPKLRVSNLKILPDDVVVVEMQPHDLTRGTIIYRK